jgi:hypothetical protein
MIGIELEKSGKKKKKKIQAVKASLFRPTDQTIKLSSGEDNVLSNNKASVDVLGKC